jgi:hypothetical protein
VSGSNCTLQTLVGGEKEGEVVRTGRRTKPNRKYAGQCEGGGGDIVTEKAVKIYAGTP